VENLDLGKKKLAVVVPSPRKVNLDKIEPTNTQSKQTNKIEPCELSPSNIKTPPRRILHARIQGKCFGKSL